MTIDLSRQIVLSWVEVDGHRTVSSIAFDVAVLIRFGISFCRILLIVVDSLYELEMREHCSETSSTRLFKGFL